MALSYCNPIQNKLLVSLPFTVRQRLLPSLEQCTLPLGKVLCESSEPIHHVNFPTDAVVSLFYVTMEGQSTEVSVIGNDGVVGITQVLRGDSTNTRAVVQIAGNAYRLPSHVVTAEFDHHTELMTISLRYLQVLMTQMVQTAVCNRHHNLEQQLCRLLPCPVSGTGIQS